LRHDGCDHSIAARRRLLRLPARHGNVKQQVRAGNRGPSAPLLRRRLFAALGGFRRRRPAAGRCGPLPYLGPLRFDRPDDLAPQLLHQFRVVAQELADVLPPLAEPLVAIREPGPTLLDDLVLDREIEDIPLGGDATPYMMSNSASLNGGATLFFTTRTRTRLPTASVPSLSVSMRRMSSRTEA